MTPTWWWIFTRTDDGHIDDRSPKALAKLVFWGALFGFVSIFWIMVLDNWERVLEIVLAQ
ncbi:MAG: hypothetical protein ACRD88_10810 [Terriglobia bacterium]